jgi:trans-2,3-dihydro-3-hydroxyanthranilate isomerase
VAPTLSYDIVDVFTDRPFAGNPLAVVFGAEVLGDEAAGTERMQAVAREFNLSETVFVLPPTQPGATYRARIFTPSTELPFAGHPSVGGAVAQLWRGVVGAGRVVQECGAGLLPIEVYADGRATLTGGPPSVGPELDPRPLLAATSLSDLDFAGPPPRMAGCGLEFPFLSVRPEAVAKAAIEPAAVRKHRVVHVSVFSWDAGTRTAHTRVFVPGLGVLEDPATGAAALGFGVWLVAAGLLSADGESSYTVRQGEELLRTSTLECTVTASGGRAVCATVTGQVAPVASGQMALP